MIKRDRQDMLVQRLFVAIRDDQLQAALDLLNRYPSLPRSKGSAVMRAFLPTFDESSPQAERDLSASVVPAIRADDFSEFLDTLFPDSTSDRRITPLHVAAAYGRSEVVTELVRHRGSLVWFKNVNINARSRRGWTPLHCAAANGCASTIEILVGHGAAIDIKNEGRTPLYLAISGGHTAAVETILNHGASIEGGTWRFFRFDPLSCAAGQGHVDIVRFLLDKRANPDGPEDSLTPLQEASAKGHAKVVKVLLDYGADPALARRHNESPLDLAKKSQHLEVVSLLKTHSSGRPGSKH